MKIFKFGGASVKDPEAVRNVASVIQRFPDESLVIVVSAMGKTTNAMEAIWESHLAQDGKAGELLGDVRAFHEDIMQMLGFSNDVEAWDDVMSLFESMEEQLAAPCTDNRDFEYDRIVSMGELVSTKIVSAHLRHEGLNSKWFDARELIRTDNYFREGKVDWDTTDRLVNTEIGGFLNADESGVAVIQGFLGHSESNETTTLGREGSDYTGAILAYVLGAESLTIWKDVPGVLNADPKWFSSTVMLEQISYREAIELAYYGASVIHPKTLKPLQNKEIPLYVRSFLHPETAGTKIQTSTASDFLIPSFIFKMKQVLISISPRDFSFIGEENLSHIFHVFAEQKIKINLMQKSALNFSVSVDQSEKALGAIEALRKRYKVLYNEGLELVTIRHYDQSTIDRVTQEKTILVEQKSRFTVRMVMRDEQGPYAPHTDYQH